METNNIPIGEYEIRIRSRVIVRSKEALFAPDGFTVSIDDDGVGEFVTVEEHRDGRRKEIAITDDEWPSLRHAIDMAIKECRPYELTEKWIPPRQEAVEDNA